MKEQCIGSKRSKSANKGNCNKKNYGYFKIAARLVASFLSIDFTSAAIDVRHSFENAFDREFISF